MGKSSSRTRFAAAVVVVAAVVGAPGAAQAQGGGARCTPGAAGVGDGYYPGYGNGGYDVREYDLDVAYDPATDRLDGKATVSAKATQSLCSLHLDLVGLEVQSIEVDGRPRDLRPRRPGAVGDPAQAAEQGAAASRSSSATAACPSSSRCRGPTSAPASWPRPTA